jgi:hypothetical protein
MKNRVPILVKHCTVAIFKEGKGVRGSTKQARFDSSLKIARARLEEYGFLAKGSEKGDANDIQLTSKGRKKEALHRRERDRKRKEALFDKLFQALKDAELEELKRGRDQDKDQDTK